jgi:hypothetical protein
VYLTGFWNWIQLIEALCLLSIFVIDMKGASEVEALHLPTLTGCTTFIMACFGFYWARMNFNTSMYSFIIFESIKGTAQFFLLCLITIFAFGLSTLILNSTLNNLSYDDGDHTGFVDEKTDIIWVNNVISQYLIMLGEFEILGNEEIPTYSYSTQWTLWALFFFGTLITNVVFFNTLVSVIGAKYEELWENRIRWGYMKQMQILGEYSIIRKPQLPVQQYVYIVVPKEVEEEEDTVTIEDLQE